MVTVLLNSETQRKNFKKWNFIREMIDYEVLEWCKMSPVERFVESQKLWEVFVLLGGRYDPEPDTQSPFYILEVQGAVPANGRTGVHPVRGG